MKSNKHFYNLLSIISGALFLFFLNYEPQTFLDKRTIDPHLVSSTVYFDQFPFTSFNLHLIADLTSRSSQSEKTHTILTTSTPYENRHAHIYKGIDTSKHVEKGGVYFQFFDNKLLSISPSTSVFRSPSDNSLFLTYPAGEKYPQIKLFEPIDDLSSLDMLHIMGLIDLNPSYIIALPSYIFSSSFDSSPLIVRIIAFTLVLLGILHPILFRGYRSFSLRNKISSQSQQIVLDNTDPYLTNLLLKDLYIKAGVSKIHESITSLITVMLSIYLSWLMSINQATIQFTSSVNFYLLSSLFVLAVFMKLKHQFTIHCSYTNRCIVIPLTLILAFLSTYILPAYFLFAFFLVNLLSFLMLRLDDLVFRYKRFRPA